MREMSGGCVRLIWAFTDNLGDWAVIRRRLNEVLDRRQNAPLAGETGAEDGLPHFLRLTGPFISANLTLISRRNWAQRCARRRRSDGRRKPPGR